MKTIIVPTDFSPAAEHAAAYAAQLSKIFEATVTLVHVYQLPVAMADMPVLMVSAEELRTGAENGLLRMKEALATAYPDVTFSTESRLGDVAEEVEDLCKDHDVVALVAGVKNVSGFERVLFGNTALSLVKKCSHPVIAVPEGAAPGAPSNLALAIDFANLDEIPAERIAAVVTQLGATLHVIHVETENEKPADPSFLLQALGVDATAYHSFHEEKVAQGISHFAEQNKIDMVIVLPHRHNLWERLFFKGHTADILQTLKVPVMTFQDRAAK